MREWEEEILGQMDREAAEYRFPMLNNAYLRGADIRLTAFSGASEWLIVFQQIGVMEERDFENVVFAYGNRLATPGLQKSVSLVGPPPGGRIRDEDGYLKLDPWDFTISIRGQVRHFRPGKEDYAAAGVDVGGDAPTLAKILRLLAAQAPEELFLPDDELRQLCGRAGGTLKRFLQLEDWYHPDLADDEPPSMSPCLRSLAHALAMDDAGLYECPAPGFNTHWSRWEEIYRVM